MWNVGWYKVPSWRKSPEISLPTFRSFSIKASWKSYYCCFHPNRILFNFHLRDMVLDCACQWKKTKPDHGSFNKMPSHRPGSSGWCCGASVVLPRYPPVLKQQVTYIFCCSGVPESNMPGMVLGIFCSVWRFAHDRPFSVGMKAIHLCPISKKDASLFPATPQHGKGDLLLFVAPQWLNHVIFFTTTQLQSVSALCVRGLLEMYCCFAAKRKRSYKLPVKETFFLFPENVNSSSFTCLQALPFNLVYLQYF